MDSGKAVVMGRCVGVSCVRNEADVIELMVRYNLQWLDELHIINNLSIDRTDWILAQLQEEGLPLHWNHGQDQDHQQEGLLSQLAHRLARRDDVEFIVPLDADELLVVPDREAFHQTLATIPPLGGGAINWRTFLPAAECGDERPYFRRMLRYRSHEPFIKLILRSRTVLEYEWLAGQHNATHRQHPVKPVRQVALANCYLAHYPVRSPLQLARKVVVGANALLQKANRLALEGGHWLKLATQLRASGYDINQIDCEAVALSYGFSDDQSEKQQVSEGGVPDAPGLKQRYPVAELSLLQVMGNALLADKPAPAQQGLAGFSVDWFSHNIPNWRYWMSGLRDVANARFLEIGCFEGRSTVWLLQHALTRADARIYCVDTFRGGMEHGELDTSRLLLRFRANVAPWRDKVVECIGDSAEVVPRLCESFHAIYIDGSHVAIDCLRDAIHGWDRLQPGGVMVFDDYGWQEYRDPALLPKTAIDGFLACIASRYKLLHKGYQVAIQKVY
jgi:hypothetical protein